MVWVRGKNGQYLSGEKSYYESEFEGQIRGEDGRIW